MEKPTGKWWKLAIAATALAAAGCFPVSVDVSPDGQVLFTRDEGAFVMDASEENVRAVLKAGENEAMPWARWSPDGKQVLIVVGAKGGGMMGGGEKVVLVPAGGGQAAELYKPANKLGYAAWDPTGKYVSVAEVSGEESKALKENMPDLKLISVADKQVKTLVGDVGLVHDWTADGKTIAAFHVRSKEEGKNIRKGDVVLIDAATGQETVIAHGRSGGQCHVDISRDGKYVAFTASHGTKKGETMPAAPEDEAQTECLFLVTVADGSVKKLDAAGVRFVLFSPDGKLLLANAAGGGETSQLVAFDVASGAKKAVAPDTSVTTSGMSDTQLIPAWKSPARVLFWQTRRVHGDKGQSLVLMAVDVDGKNRKNLQARMDIAVAKMMGE